MIYNYKARINIIRALVDLIWFMPLSDPLIQVFIINPFPSLIISRDKVFQVLTVSLYRKKSIEILKFEGKFFSLFSFFFFFLFKVICLVIVWRFCNGMIARGWCISKLILNDCFILSAPPRYIFPSYTHFIPWRKTNKKQALIRMWWVCDIMTQRLC